MKTKKDWHKLKADPQQNRREEKAPLPASKPPAQTESLRGSRQGNAGMERDTDGVHR